MQQQLILRCEEQIDAIFTALYEGFIQKSILKQNYADNILIVMGEGDTQTLFSTEIFVEADEEKAAKLVGAIQRKLGHFVYQNVFYALCHFQRDRATIVFRYLVRAFATGPGIQEQLADPYVMRVLELSRKVTNESQKMNGFLRFREAGGRLIAEFAPKCDILPMIAEHFCDRYPNENFLIYDQKRQYALVHPAFQTGFFVVGEKNTNAYMQDLDKTDRFEQLWKDYFGTMAIEQRENERCQNNLLPKWFRKNMSEFLE